MNIGICANTTLLTFWSTQRLAKLHTDGKSCPVSVATPGECK